jgi:hypothetical protein
VHGDRLVPLPFPGDSVGDLHRRAPISEHPYQAYERGQRSGAWIKYRTNMEQEFVIGGYIPGAHGFDA